MRATPSASALCRVFVGCAEDEEQPSESVLSPALSALIHTRDTESILLLMLQPFSVLPADERRSTEPIFISNMHTPTLLHTLSIKTKGDCLCCLYSYSGTLHRSLHSKHNHSFSRSSHPPRQHSCVSLTMPHRGERRRHRHTASHTHICREDTLGRLETLMNQRLWHDTFITEVQHTYRDTLRNTDIQMMQEDDFFREAPQHTHAAAADTQRTHEKRRQRRDRLCDYSVDPGGCAHAVHARS